MHKSREVADLDGGTQMLEDPDSEDEFWKDVDISNDMVETQRTEVLSDGEGVSDDGTTFCRIENFGSEKDIGDKAMGSEKEQLGPLLSHRKGSKDVVVNSYSTKDRECSPGSPRRSFTSVRISSLRCSGLAAACSMTYNGISIRQNPISSINQAMQKQSNDKILHSGASCFENGNGITRLRNPSKPPTFTGMEVHEQDHVNVAKNSEGDMHKLFGDEARSRIKNSRVRKLVYEDTPSGEEDEMNKIGITMEKTDPPQFPSSERVVAGLSYVGSQEPGEESQSSALNTVDRFLALNDVDLSGEVDTGKILGRKSPPVSSAKGAQSLAKRICLRSPDRKEGVFDWIDSREDETGGDFFSKRKVVLFENIQPQKPKDLTFRRNESTIGKSRGDGKERDTEIHQKGAGSPHLESRLMLPSSNQNDKTHKCETQAKDLFTELGEQSIVAYFGEKVETTDIGDDGIYEVGVCTQMAAEALQALGCGPPANHNIADTLPLTRYVTEKSSMGATINRCCSKNVSVKKRYHCTSDSYRTRSKSKQIKMFATKLSEGNSNSRDQLTKSSMEMLRKESPIKGRAKEKPKDKYDFDSGRPVNSNESGKPVIFVKRGQAGGAVTRTYTEQVDKCQSSSILNKYPSFCKGVVQEEHLSEPVIPIAHRTRQSMMNPLKRVKLLPDNLLQVTSCSTIDGNLWNKSRVVDSAADLPEPINNMERLSKSGLDRIQTLRKCNTNQLKQQNVEERMHEEKWKVHYRKKDVLSYAKGWRTPRSKSVNLEKTNSIVAYVEHGVVVEPNPHASTRGRYSKTNIRSVDTVKRITRSSTRALLPTLPLATAVLSKADASSCSSPNTTVKGGTFVSEPCVPSTDHLASVGRIVPLVSGSRMLSSETSDSCMFSEKISNESMFMDKLHKPASADTAFNCAMDVTNGNVHAKDQILLTSGAYVGSGSDGGGGLSTFPCEDVGHVQGSPKEKGPSKEINALSPVCMGDEPHKLLGKRCSFRSSLMKELTRLDATEPKQTPALKDTRRRKDMASVCVLFSHHLGEDIIKQQKKILARLGASIVSFSSEATHFIADRFVRTRNMLEAMALGKPVVTHFWIDSCGQASCFIEEKNYILRDLKKEKDIGFSMPVSLARACQKPLLQGKRVYITPNVKPNRELVGSLVKAVQGQAIERIGRSKMKDDKMPTDLLVISCEEDYALCKPLLEKGAEIYNSELLLNGIVIQKLEYERHRLFMDRVKRTRSTIWLRKGGNRFHPSTECI